MSEERCVMCGDIIPEGRQICQKCEKHFKEKHFKGVDPEKQYRKVQELGAWMFGRYLVSLGILNLRHLEVLMAGMKKSIADGEKIMKIIEDMGVKD